VEFLRQRNWMEVSGHLHDAAALLPGKEPLVPIGYVGKWVGGPQSHSGRGGEEENSHPCRDSNPRSSSPEPNAVQLSYPGSSEKIEPFVTVLLYGITCHRF
jgi:hypothetical protein